MDKGVNFIREVHQRAKLFVQLFLTFLNLKHATQKAASYRECRESGVLRYTNQTNGRRAAAKKLDLRLLIARSGHEKVEKYVHKKFTLFFSFCPWITISKMIL